jgi:ATP-dependent exoDNAse (exonuclease V) alpha subunit
MGGSPDAPSHGPTLKGIGVLPKNDNMLVMVTLSDVARPEREPFSGLVERVTYHNADNGWAVLRVKARGHRDLVTVVGHVAAISPGEFIQASGRWTTHRDHGQQFAADFLKAAPPMSLEDIEKYLGSGLVKGIGPHFAKRLVKAFGEAVFASPPRTSSSIFSPIRASAAVAASARCSSSVGRSLIVCPPTSGPRSPT